MSPTVTAAGVLVVAVALSSLTAAPLGYGARRRRLERRRRWVAARPQAAMPADVVDLLRRSGLLAREARELTEHAAEHGVGSASLFGWLDRIAADERVALFRGGLTPDAVVEHVRLGTVPTVASLADEAVVAETAAKAVEAAAEVVAEAAPAATEEVLAAAAAVVEVPTEPVDLDDEGAVAVAVLPAAAVEPALVEPPAAAADIDDPDSAPAATATLLGSGLGSQTPVP